MILLYRMSYKSKGFYYISFILNDVMRLIFLLLLSVAAFSQERKDYTQYYEQLLEAEEAVSNEDFDTAIVLYAAIFENYRPYARDAYNACQIAALEDDSRFGDFFTACAKSGLAKERLLGNGYIRKAYNKNAAMYDSLYLQGRAVYGKQTDTALRKEFEQRYAREQASKGKPDYAKICTDNFNRIKQLAEEGRFPGEGLIGPGEDMGSDLALPTLLHYPYSYTALKGLLWQAVLEGKIQPGEVLYLYGFNQTRTSVLYTHSIPVDTENFTACYGLPFGKRCDDSGEVDRQRKLRYISSTKVEAGLRKIASRLNLDYRFQF